MTLFQSFETFDDLYRPIYRDDGFWNHDDLPSDLDPHFWWTVTFDGRCYRLVRGLHIANHIGFIRCEVPWRPPGQLCLPF